MRRPPGVLHGAWTYVLQDEDGQIAAAHSLAAGLDYPGVGPEHCWLQATGRASYLAVRRRRGRGGSESLARTEGILCALESAHAVAGALSWRRTGPGATCSSCLSGRGDKDVPELAARARAAAQEEGAA